MNKYRERDHNYKRVAQQLFGILQESLPGIPKGPYHRNAHWLVPLERNRNFVSRESILQHVLERADPYTSDQYCQRTAIVGLGSVGKTQITVEAVYRLRNKHPDCSVFWVPAVDATSYENAYREIGQKLDLSGIDDENADTKKSVKAALSEQASGMWLLVVDNADDTKLLLDKTASSLAQYLPFSEMSNNEAHELLRKGLKDKQIRDIVSTSSLLDFLANLPLAIKQASAYIAKTGITTTKYLDYCQFSDGKLITLLSKDFEDRTRYREVRNPIATTWLISFDYMLWDNPLAAECLRCLCFLAGKEIPRGLLLLLADDEIEADRAIGTLVAYAFLTEREDGRSYDIHRLVQIAARNWNREKGEWQERATRAVQQVAAWFPIPNHENRHTWTYYLPHAQSLLQFRRDVEDKKAKRDLLFNVDGAFLYQCKYNEAEAIYREALQLKEKALGRDHPHTPASMNNLSGVLDSQGKHDEAEAMHRVVLQSMEKALDRDHPNTFNLTFVLGGQDKHDKAEKPRGERKGNIGKGRTTVACDVRHGENAKDVVKLN